jgi:hypothetical protein
MKLKLNVELVDGEIETVSVRPKTQVQFERHFSINLDKNIGAQHIYWLAWKSSGVVKKYDDWLDDIEGVEVVDDDDATGDGGEIIDPLDQKERSGT